MSPVATNSEEFRIKEFAGLKGPWMIYWIDHVKPSRGSGVTPKIRVKLVQLSRRTADLRFRDVVADLEARREFFDVQISLIPTLRIGAVYENGILIDPLHLPIGNIRISLLPEPRITSVGADLDPKPSSWLQDKPYRVLNRGEYYLGTSLSSNCVVGRGTEDRIYIIPCYEVLRTFYAFHSLMANALFSRWDREMVSVIRPGSTFVREDGSWQIYLEKHIPDEFGGQIANLVLTDYGFQCAKSIFSSYLGSSEIAVPIPFKIGRLDLKVKMHQVRAFPPKFLVTEIVGVRWPYRMPVIHVDRENSNEVGEKTERKDAPKPYGERLNSGSSPQVPEITSASDPEDGQTTTLHGAKIDWTDLPKVVRVKKEISYKYGPPVRRNSDAPDVISAGIPDGDLQGRASVSLPDKGLSDRFSDLLVALEELKKANQIADWSVLPPPKNVLGRAGVACWPFPANKGRPPWCFLTRDKKHRRAALVTKVKLKEREILILEIELRGAEGGFTALFGECRGVAKIYPLLFATAQANGVWPKEGAKNFGFSKFKARRHPPQAGGSVREWVLDCLSDL